MYGLWNIVTHEYFEIDNEMIWEIAKNDLPKNLADLRQLIELEKNGNVAKNSWWYWGFIVVNYKHKVAEEIGSAGEQPISNKLYRQTVSIVG